MRLLSTDQMISLINGKPVKKHLDYFDHPYFNQDAETWYRIWLEGLKRYLFKRQERKDDVSRCT